MFLNRSLSSILKNKIHGHLNSKNSAKQVLFLNDMSIKQSYTKTKYGGYFMVSMIAGDPFDSKLMRHVKDIFRLGRFPVDFEELHLDSTEESVDKVNEVITSIKRNGAAIKGNIITNPDDLKQQSKNVILRNKLDIFANVLHCKSQPGIKTKHANVDIILIRQNTEGEYSCLEHESVPGVVESLKIVTKEKSEEIARFAFEYATKKNRRKITTVHKANDMPLTDGLFLKACYEVSKDYPQIEFNTTFLNTCCTGMITDPTQFDVFLLPNLYGNILSNIACGLIGGAGIAPGQNYGHDCAVFEIGSRSSSVSSFLEYVNPVPILSASANLLEYLGLEPHAEIIDNAIYKTLNDDKILTPDLGGNARTCDVVNHIKQIVQHETRLL